jgi:hypothetical protein
MPELKDSLSLVQAVRFIADGLEPHGYKMFTRTLRDAADEIQATRDLLTDLQRKGGLGSPLHDRIEGILNRTVWLVVREDGYAETSNPAGIEGDPDRRLLHTQLDTPDVR